MRIGPFRAVHVVAALLLLIVGLWTAGCSAFGGDYNTFSPAGEVAEKQRNLFYLVLVPAVLILIGVLAVTVYIVVRFRQRSDDEPLPKQVHGNNRLEVAWTIAPAILLIGLAVPTVMGIIDLGRDPKPEALHVRVIAFQWDWRFEYTDPEFADADGEPLITEEFHIPVDREIGVELESPDVIHSFWVPKLAGKLDVMPGRTNEMWFNAEEEGVFSGQCAEFCGIGHAVMKFDVTAESEADFQAWVDEQIGESVSATEGDVSAAGEASDR